MYGSEAFCIPPAESYVAVESGQIGGGAAGFKTESLDSGRAGGSLKKPDQIIHVEPDSHGYPPTQGSTINRNLINWKWCFGFLKRTMHLGDCANAHP
jgi:hypothetical protein